jgi:hypothetical protein
VGRPPGEDVGPLGGGRVVYKRDVYILNEIWAQNKIVYYGRHFAWLKYFIYQLVSVGLLAPNYKEHILSLVEVRKVCYSLAERYVNLFI